MTYLGDALELMTSLQTGWMGQRSRHLEDCLEEGKLGHRSGNRTGRQWNRRGGACDGLQEPGERVWLEEGVLGDTKTRVSVIVCWSRQVVSQCLPGIRTSAVAPRKGRGDLASPAGEGV